LEFLKLHQVDEVKLGRGFEADRKTMGTLLNGKVAGKEVDVALGEFYLHVALQLWPQKIDEAGSDNAALLKVARDCAEEEFEPLIDSARDFVSDYDPALHKALEDTSIWYESTTPCFGRPTLTSLHLRRSSTFLLPLATAVAKAVLRKRRTLHLQPSLRELRRFGKV